MGVRDALQSWAETWAWMDASATGAWLQAYAGFAQAAAVLVVAYKGAGVLRTWKRQKIAERQFDTAERVAVLSHRLKRAFEDVRMVLITSDELAKASAMLSSSEQEQYFNELPPKRRQRAITAQAMLNRVGRHSAEWDDLSAVIPLAQAFLDPEISQHLTTVWMQRGRLLVSAEMYAEDFANDPDLFEQIRRDLWQVLDRQNNQINTALDSAFSAINRLLGPILREAAGIAD